MADDLGKYEVSAYGAEHISTPNIDQIGEEGVLFNDAYVTAPICAPSRAAILTGQYQQRYGFETQPMDFYPSNFIEYNRGKKAKFLGDWKLVTPPSYPREWEIAKQGIPQTEINLAEVMSASGYHTGIIGKWHLGQGKEQVPNKRGFTYQYGFYGAFSLYTPSQKTPGYQSYIQDDMSAEHQWNMKRHETAAIRENGKVVKEEDYLTFAIRDKAIDFLEENKDTNFFLYVPFNAPHVPFQAPQAYFDQFSHVKDTNKRVYLAMIKALDDAIGDIHNKIKNLGLEENTIIYFISDNGGASYTGATDNGPLKGGKITHFEGGINVPFMMKWKGKIPAGTKFVHPVSGMDIFTTTIKNCHVNWPENRPLDGVDLIPFILGTDKTKPHEVLYWRTDHIQAIQSEKWKLILSTRDNWMHLYDLENDISERFDLKSTQPQRLEKLQSLFEEWNKELPIKPLWPRLMDRKFDIDSASYYFPA
ncbi:sulfatase-like hydrolase/transferase [Paracrocinitomix mangrovi]|nr:sulfatase-like hydrolase/transferase [Paracrocinitomix mangrovi]